MQGHPIGTAVLCIGPHGLPLRKSCEGHIFEIISAPMPVEWADCGFAQAAKCLFCWYDTPMVDGDWWLRKADGMDLAGFSGLVSATIEGLEEGRQRAMRLVAGLEEAVVLRDFG